MKRPKVAMNYERQQAAICKVDRLVYQRIRKANPSFLAVPLLSLMDCAKRLNVSRASILTLIHLFKSQGLNVWRAGTGIKARIYVPESEFNEYLEAYRENKAEKIKQKESANA